MVTNIVLVYGKAGVTLFLNKVLIELNLLNIFDFLSVNFVSEL